MAVTSTLLTGAENSGLYSLESDQHQLHANIFQAPSLSALLVNTVKDEKINIDHLVHT